MPDQSVPQETFERCQRYVAEQSDEELSLLVLAKPRDTREQLLVRLAARELARRGNKRDTRDTVGKGLQAAWDAAWSQGYQGCMAAVSVLLILSCFLFDRVSGQVKALSLGTRVLVIGGATVAAGIIFGRFFICRRRDEMADGHSPEGMTVLFPTGAGNAEIKNDENNNT